MNGPLPNRRLAEGIQAGDSAAAADLVARFEGDLCRLAARHLGRALAARTDGEEVVQSAFRTFFRRAAAGQFRIDSTTELWALLAVITRRKALAKARAHTAPARDVRAEAPAADGFLAAAPAAGPTPDEEALLADLLEAVVAGFPDLHRRVLEFQLQGRTVAEMAASLDVSERTVNRVLKVLRDRLRQLTAD